MKLLLIAVAAVAVFADDSDIDKHCVAECGKLADIIKASDDADALVWKPECKACWRAKCETDEFKGSEKKAASCAAHKGCDAEWTPCTEAKSWSSDGCCNYGKCVCAANPKDKVCAPMKGHCKDKM